MCPTDGSSGLMSDPLLNAHKSIRECLRELKLATDDDRMRSSLHCLEGILPPHFAYEERPKGFIERLEATNAEAAEGLRNDHREITALLTTLLAATELDRAEVKRLGDLLARHEDLENKLAIDPFSQDEGKKWRGYA